MAATELPARPNLEHYRKTAKELLKECRAGNPEAMDRLTRHHPRLARESDRDAVATRVKLADAQFVIAREHGFESWPKFVKGIEARSGTLQAAAVWHRAERAIESGDVAALEPLLRDHERLLRTGRPQSSWLGGLTPDYSASDARAIIAKNHEFESWSQFAAFAAALGDPSSATARFERGVDAVVSGTLSTLEMLLRGNDDLIRLRSTRKHHSTLLHYVGANGVEGFRQKTPENAVRIAEVLLDAGAEVDAVADMYGGSTTLGLVATSIHPERAGVQRALIDLLISRGASISRPGAGGHNQLLVNSCLANGRAEAAEILAERGAPLDLEGAAGIGRLDIVRTFFDDEGGLRATATSAQMTAGFTWACEYGRTDVADFLLDHGMKITAALKHHGETGLHWAALGGHPVTVALLLRRGASVDAVDKTWGGTPLGWALFGWRSRPPRERDRYYDVVGALVGAGAAVRPEWLADEEIRREPELIGRLSRGA